MCLNVLSGLKQESCKWTLVWSLLKSWHGFYLFGVHNRHNRQNACQWQECTHVWFVPHETQNSQGDEQTFWRRMFARIHTWKNSYRTNGWLIWKPGALVSSCLIRDKWKDTSTNDFTDFVAQRTEQQISTWNAKCFQRCCCWHSEVIKIQGFDKITPDR